MFYFNNSIDDLKMCIKDIDELIEIQKAICFSSSFIFLSTKDVAEILRTSTGQVKRLFLREDFPACNYFKAQKIEYNAFLAFLEEHYNENKKFENAYLNLKGEKYE